MIYSGYIVHNSIINGLNLVFAESMSEKFKPEKIQKKIYFHRKQWLGKKWGQRNHPSPSVSTLQC